MPSITTTTTTIHGTGLTAQTTGKGSHTVLVARMVALTTGMLMVELMLKVQAKLQMH